MLVVRLATGLNPEVVWATGLTADDELGVVVAEGPAKEGFDGTSVAVEDSKGPVEG